MQRFRVLSHDRGEKRFFKEEAHEFTASDFLADVLRHGDLHSIGGR
jgi:hypothetical protein